MDMLRKFWPHAFRANDVKSLVITIIIYILFNFVAGLIIGFLAALPLIGFVFGVIGSVLGLYCTVGIVLAILNMLKVFK